MYAEPWNQCSRKTAASIPALEASKAVTGTPRLLRRPKASGAYPPRDKENSIRDVKYKLQFTLDKAAVSTTKFITSAAAGMRADSKTRTIALSPSPTVFQGIPPTTTANPPT